MKNKISLLLATLLVLLFPSKGQAYEASINNTTDTVERFSTTVMRRGAIIQVNTSVSVKCGNANYSFPVTGQYERNRGAAYNISIHVGKNTQYNITPDYWVFPEGDRVRLEVTIYCGGATSGTGSFIL